MKNIKNILLRVCFAAGLMLVAAGAFAQQKMTVSGTVKDSKGEPIIGAAILLEGTNTGAVTDIDGKYTITFTAGKTAPKLVYSSIAYLSQTIAVGNRGIIDVVLQDDAEQLDEVVVVGYGSMRRSDLTGSVTSVKIDETQAGQSASLDQLLQGHAAGVQVVSNSAAPDAGVNITIRGASSFNTNSQPLYVVDGVIMNTDTDVKMSSHGGSDSSGADEATNGLMGISPNDIASMEILKDASATAIYGSQGANGVVLITTKSANREKPVINFSAGIDISRLYKKFNLLTADNYTDFLDLKGVAPTAAAYLYYTQYVEEGRYEPVDWQDYTTRTGVNQRYYLSIAARPKDTSYRLSLNYNDTQGIIKGTGLSNLTVRLNLDKTLGKFSFGTKSAISYLKSKMTQGMGSSTRPESVASSMVTSMLRTRPLRYTGAGVDEDGDEFDDDDAPVSGPERWLTDHQSQRTELRVTPSIYAQYKILPWLTFKSTFGADYRAADQNKFKSRRLNTEATGSIGTEVHTDRINWNWDNLFMVNKKWGKHNLSGTLGQSSFYKSTLTQTSEGTEIAQYRVLIKALNAAPNTWLTYGESYEQQLSFFGRAIYSYDDRYVLTATYRFDGSSKFAGKNKWAQFPSLAFAWRINQEPWFNVPFISTAKVRLGWGMSGNDRVPAYQTVYSYSTATFSSHDSATNKVLTAYSTKLPTADLKWETTEQYNVGLDLGLWKGRLTLEADWYKKTTKDLLQTKTVPGSAGISNPYVNMGSIQNTGIELTMSATPVLSRDFEWNISGNISFNKNKILTIDPSGLNSGYIWLDRNDTEKSFVEYFTGSTVAGGLVCRDYINVFITGQPMGLFYGMATDGIVPVGKEGVPNEAAPSAYRGPGAINYVDVNKDGVISAEDRTIIGNPNPDFIYGFSTSLRYKRLTLSASFTGSYGNDIYNQGLMSLSSQSSTSNNLLYDATLGAWSPDNQTSKWPGIGCQDAADLNWCSELFVEDGSYLRLANLSVSYDLPIKNKNSFLKGLNLGLSARNLYVWTKYSGYDPDVNIYGTALKRGADAGSYPSARTYMFDIKFTF